MFSLQGSLNPSASAETANTRGASGAGDFCAVDTTCPRGPGRVNTKIRLIIFFAAKDGEALYSQQKQDWEQTVTQIMNSLLPNSDWT